MLGIGRHLLLRFALAFAALNAPIAAFAQPPAADKIMQQAVNYVFTGRIDPSDQPVIVDTSSCVVIVPDRKFNRFVRYYLSRFKMNEALFTKRYSGTRPIYELDVDGDAAILDYLGPDQKTVLESFKSAQIPLPGDIDRTKKALEYIFSTGCKSEKENVPF